MKATRPELPLAPLLHAYLATGKPSLGELQHLLVLGPRFAAILSATAKFLYSDFVENAPAESFRDALVRFYEACVQPPLHVETLRRRAGMVRHGLAYLLRGRDPAPVKAARCLDASGIYFVPGLGPSFWSAVLQALQPERNPGWTPAILSGLERLGLLQAGSGDSAEDTYATLVHGYLHIQSLQPGLTALHVDHFLTLLAAMKVRNLPTNDELGTVGGTKILRETIQRERSRTPLRQCLKERGQALASGQKLLESALGDCDGKRIGDALASADLQGSLRSPLDWQAQAEMLTLWVGRLWETEDPYHTLAAFWEAEPLSGAGLWLPAAVLHLRDPQNFAPWNEDLRDAFNQLTDATPENLPLVERYRLFNEAIAWLRQTYQIHPLEMPAILAGLAQECDLTRTTTFSGFCSDTFAFLRELRDNNRRDWMERHRNRYRFAVREPMLELCRLLAERYVEPVLRGVHGWGLDTQPRNGRALTSICKNDYGRSQPYNTALWIAYCRRTQKSKREDVQFFVRLDAEGIRYGLRIGRKARALVAHFRQQVRKHADLLYRVLHERGTLSECRFRNSAESELVQDITSPDDLREWVQNRSFEISRSLSVSEVLQSGEELPGEILLTFDRLLPIYVCAVEQDARDFLGRCLGGVEQDERYGEHDFERATFLGGDWLDRACGLLKMKRQLILQGVPGTGKTHVARHLASFLTAGREDRLRLVQFHPAYTYEEFVEGITVRSVMVDGRSDVTYPVEAGLLCAFAAEAERRPAESFVLLIDELNRGNLPRIFGELLYLLEYREQSVCLPCSRRNFRLPSNLYLLATMNAADRSVALIDQALRRRFSILEMPPDAAVLARWFQAHAPAGKSIFADQVLHLFERLNAGLRADLGSQEQIGHSYFMIPELDEKKLRLVWEHHVWPQLVEKFSAQPARLTAYELDKLLDGGLPRSGRRRRVETV